MLLSSYSSLLLLDGQSHIKWLINLSKLIAKHNNSTTFPHHLSTVVVHYSFHSWALRDPIERRSSPAEPSRIKKEPFYKTRLSRVHWWPPIGHRHRIIVLIITCWVWVDEEMTALAVGLVRGWSVKWIRWVPRTEQIRATKSDLLGHQTRISPFI